MGTGQGQGHRGASLWCVLPTGVSVGLFGRPGVERDTQEVDLVLLFLLKLALGETEARSQSCALAAANPDHKERVPQNPDSPFYVGHRHRSLPPSQS